MSNQQILRFFRKEQKDVVIYMLTQIYYNPQPFYIDHEKCIWFYEDDRIGIEKLDRNDVTQKMDDNTINLIKKWLINNYGIESARVNQYNTEIYFRTSGSSFFKKLSTLMTEKQEAESVKLESLIKKEIGGDIEIGLVLNDLERFYTSELFSIGAETNFFWKNF